MLPRVVTQGAERRACRGKIHLKRVIFEIRDRLSELDRTFCAILSYTKFYPPPQFTSNHLKWASSGAS